MKHIKTYEKFSIKDWWERPRNQGMSDNGSNKDIYNELKWILSIPFMGTNLLLEYGYKSLIYLIERYGKSLRDIIKKIKNDDVLSVYLDDPNFRIDFSEEPYTGENSKSIFNSRLREILSDEEMKLFSKYLYRSQSLLKN